MLELYKSTIEKHSDIIEVDTLIEMQQVAYILLTLREILELKLVLVVKLITIHTLLHIPKNDILPKITDFTIIAEPMQIVQILTAKKIRKVNANKLFRVFVHLNYII